MNSAPPRVNMLNMNLLCAIHKLWTCVLFQKFEFWLHLCLCSYNVWFAYVCGGTCMAFIWRPVAHVDILIWLDIWFEIVLLLHINSGADTIATLSKYENIKKSNLCIDILFWDNFSTNAVNPRKMPLTLIMSRIKQ